MAAGAVRSWLYAPGNRPRLLEKVFRVGADAVVLDLEDSVPASEKAAARAYVSEVLRHPREGTGPLICVRLNHPDTGHTQQDIEATLQPGLHSYRVPKVDSPETVKLISEMLEEAEGRAGLAVGGVRLICTIETAVAVWRVHDIAAAERRIYALQLGAADLARDLGVRGDRSGRALLYSRSQIVVASRVADLRPPIDSAYLNTADLGTLAREARGALALGFFGKSAIHPDQIPVINRAFTPTDAEVEWAREVISAADTAAQLNSGAVKLPSGEFIDVAVVRRAQDLIALRESLNALPDDGRH